MSDDSEPRRKVGDVAELVHLFELTAVTFREVSAARLTDDDPSEVAESGSETADFDIAIAVNRAEDGHTFGQRFRLTLDHMATSYAAVVQTEFRSDEPLDIETPALTEFIERVAIMAAYPYLREAISSSAARLQVPAPVLGLLRQGQFSVGDDSEAQSENAPTDA